jgi:hypothetical protein
MLEQVERETPLSLFNFYALCIRRTKIIRTSDFPRKGKINKTYRIFLFQKGGEGTIAEAEKVIVFVLIYLPLLAARKTNGIAAMIIRAACLSTVKKNTCGLTDDLKHFLIITSASF